MRHLRGVSWLGVAVLTTVIAGSGVAAGISSDRAAAILKFPLIETSSGILQPIPVYPATQPDAQAGLFAGAVDSLVQLTNTSDAPANAHCFYENSNAHCSNTGGVCDPWTAASCCFDGLGCGECQPGWNEIDFWVRLTPRQPLGWSAADGLVEFPIDGDVRTGVDGSSNRGSRVPPVPETPFIGSLKCVVVDDSGTPIDQNVLKGEVSIVERSEGFLTANLDVAKYNAIGIQAIEGAVNDDRELVLGGPEPEYEGCPSVLILNHFFDGVVSPVTNAPFDEVVRTMPILVPCQQDLLRQIPGKTVVQYLVFNEFEQRFSTSRTVDCQQAIQLSLIDTTQPRRSIFSAGVAGTVTGQTRLAPLEAGLVGVALEYHGDQTAAFNLHYQGDRPDPDVITLP